MQQEDDNDKAKSESDDVLGSDGDEGPAVLNGEKAASGGCTCTSCC